MDSLVSFEITSLDKEYYKVDLVEGILDCNGKHTVDFDIPEGKKAELIYFRRIQERRNVDGKTLDSRTNHHIGLKYGSEEKVVVAFPGLDMVEKKVVVQSSNKEKKEENVEDITKKV